MRWVEPDELLLFHDWLLNIQPGVKGIKHKDTTCAVVNRVHNLMFYEGETDLFELAAQYLMAIARGHVFNDANKRSALFICILFLRRNGIEVRDDSEELVRMTVSAANGTLERSEIADILRSLSVTQKTIR